MVPRYYSYLKLGDLEEEMGRYITPIDNPRILAAYSAIETIILQRWEEDMNSQRVQPGAFTNSFSSTVFASKSLVLHVDIALVGVADECYFLSQELPVVPGIKAVFFSSKRTLRWHT